MESESEIDREVEDLLGDGSSSAVGSRPRPKRQRRNATPPEEPRMPPPVEEEPREEETPAPRRAKEESVKEGPEISTEQLDASMLTSASDAPMPKVVENVKTIGDLIARFGIGQRPDFKLQLFRLWPKLFTGNRKADGFYDEYTMPIDEMFIANEYGGGVYRVSVIGPHPQSPTGNKHFDSVKVDLGGLPREDRLPRSERHSNGEETPAAAVAPPPPFVMQAAKDDPKIVSAVLDTAKELATSERQERQRVEDRAERNVEEVRKSLQPVLDAERRRADDVVRLERQAAEERVKAADERSRVERERAEEKIREAEQKAREERARAEDIERRAREMEASRPSVASELKELMPYINKGDDGKGQQMALAQIERSSEMAKQMLHEVSQQHATAVAAIRAAYDKQLADTRSNYDAAVASMREAHQRELTAEREASRSREQRAEDMVRAEREERNRDRERHREQTDERDRTWKDRFEQLELNLKAQWESRLAVVETGKAERIAWLEREVDRRDVEIRELKEQARESRDPLSLMTRASELKSAAMASFGLLDKDMAPAAVAVPGGGGGGGLAGMDFESLAETALEEGPRWLEALGKMMRGEGQQSQVPQHRPGDVVQTQHGPMVVVQTPAGLQLTPYQGTITPAPTQTPLLPADAPQRRASRPQGGAAFAQPQPQAAPSRRRRVREEDEPEDVQPNLADEIEVDGKVLPKLDAPSQWKKKRRAAAAPATAAPAPTPVAPSMAAPAPLVMAPAPPAHPPQSARQMGKIERQIVEKLAVAVNESIENGDEPQDFVKKMLSANYPDAVVKGIAKRSDQDMISAIATVAPDSPSTTAGGVRFIHDAMNILRKVVAATAQASAGGGAS